MNLLRVPQGIQLEAIGEAELGLTLPRDHDAGEIEPAIARAHIQCSRPSSQPSQADQRMARKISVGMDMPSSKLHGCLLDDYGSAGRLVDSAVS